MSEDVQIKGPKIQRDVALLLRLLCLLDRKKEPRSMMGYTTRFVELVGGFEPCSCSSCDSMVSSSKATAAILLPHIEEIITLDRYHPDVVESKVFHMIERYLLCFQEDVPDVIATVE